MSNRTRNEIIAEMLASVESPSPKTAMMYGARLSYAQLKHYHDYLSEKGLIEQVGGLWVATEKGRSFLKAYAQAEEILKDSAQKSN
jgi:predicted transcriptional regulator